MRKSKIWWNPFSSGGDLDIELIRDIVLYKYNRMIGDDELVFDIDINHVRCDEKDNNNLVVLYNAILVDYKEHKSPTKTYKDSITIDNEELLRQKKLKEIGI